MTEWKKYDGTDEQISEMQNAEHGYTCRTKSGCLDGLIFKWEDPRELPIDIDEYLLVEPHPLADMIIRQAQTGQPVWTKKPTYAERFDTEAKTNVFYLYECTDKPNWNILGAEYRFTPFDE